MSAILSSWRFRGAIVGMYKSILAELAEVFWKIEYYVWQ